MTFSLKDLFCMVAYCSVFLAGLLYARNIYEGVDVVQRPIDPALASVGTLDLFFRPDSFRADLNNLIQAQEYREAIGLLVAANIGQLVTDGEITNYFGIPGYDDKTGVRVIVLPGIGEVLGSDDVWVMPKSGYESESQIWADACFEFAKKYNLYALKTMKNPNTTNLGS